MCLLNKTPEYIILFLLLLSKNIFGTYGSSGPPPSLFRDNDNYHSIATTTTPAPLATTTTSILSTTNNTTAAASDSASFTNTTMKPEKTWSDITLLVLEVTIMISIIVAAVFGNLLVIISVMRNRKLRWVSLLLVQFSIGFLIRLLTIPLCLH